ncbi:MAG: hypothetical protein ISS36_02155 [Candidatus Aenigmarchaeota archaeon]|nr:hypothetical protein [Candidatus Aenigmarchaeota archaeon]
MKSVFFGVFAFLLLINSVYALSTPTPDMSITIEKGTDYNYALVVQNTENTTQTITFTSPNSWVTFEGNSNYSTNILAYVPTYVNVKVAVPSDVGVGTYTTQINANNVKLADLDIKVTLSINEVENLQSLANVNAEISNLKYELENIINSMRTNLSSRIDDIEQYKSKYESLNTEKTELERKVNDLTGRISDLSGEKEVLETEKQHLGEITGKLTATQPTFFGIGFVVGLLIFFAFTRGKKFLKFPKLKLNVPKLKSEKVKSEKKDDSKYSFKPK